MKKKFDYFTILIFLLSTTSFRTANSASTDFLGGSFWFTPVTPNDQTKINLFYTLGWATPAACQAGVQAIGDPVTITTTGGPLPPSNVICTDSGTTDYQYSSGVQSVVVNVPPGSTATETFYDGGPWKNTIALGNWRFHLGAQTLLRPDTLSVNNSPVGGFIPQFVVYKNCPFNNGTPWQLPVTDPDSTDVVRCRFSDDCGAVCTSLPTTISNFNVLTLTTFTNCSLLMNPKNVGTFGIGLQLEDIAAISPNAAISTVPIEFLINVRDDGVTNCATRPSIVSPTINHMACLGVLPNGTFTQRIYMQAGVGAAKVDSLLPSLPRGMTVSAVGVDPLTSLFAADLTWPNPPPGLNMACLSAVNSNKLVSEPYCLSICSGYPTPQIVSIEPNFTTTGFNRPTNFTITFNMPVNPGKGHFRVSAAAPGTTTFTQVYDETPPSNYLFINGSNRVVVDLSPLPYRDNFFYRFDIDNGIVQSQNCCGIYPNISIATRLFTTPYQAPATGNVTVPPFNIFTTTTTTGLTTTRPLTTTTALTTTTTTAHTTTTSVTTTTTAHTTTRAPTTTTALTTTTTGHTTTTALTTTSASTTTGHTTTLPTTTSVTTTTGHTTTLPTTTSGTTTTGHTTTLPTTTSGTTTTGHTTTLPTTTSATTTTAHTTTTGPTTTTTTGPTTTVRPAATCIVPTPAPIIVVTVPVPYVITVQPYVCNCTQPDWANIFGNLYGNMALLWRNISFNIFNNYTINVGGGVAAPPSPIYINVVPPAPPVTPPPAPVPPPPPPAPSPIIVIPPQAVQPCFILQPFIAPYAYPQYQIGYYNYPNMCMVGSITLPFDAFSRGVVGDAILFNGLNQYLTIQPPNCNGCFGNLAACSTGLSMCSWYMPLAVSSTDQYVFSGYGVLNSNQPQLALIQTSTLGLQVYISAGQNTYYLANSGTNTLKPGTWAHVCFSYQQSVGINLYVNGICSSCANPSMGLYYVNFPQQYPQAPVYPTYGTTNQCMLYVGRPSFTVGVGAGYGRFGLDQFQIWQSALSPVAIYQIYATAQPGFLWSANAAPPLSTGSTYGSAAFTSGYNGLALQCSNPGDGLIWTQPLFNQAVTPVSLTGQPYASTYQTLLGDAVSASLKFQLLQPAGQAIPTTQQYLNYYEMPIFALTLPSTLQQQSLYANAPPRLALSYDPFAGFRAVYWANGTIWAINSTPTYTLANLMGQQTYQGQSLYSQPLFVSGGASFQQSLTPWREILIRASPINGLQLFLDGSLAGTGAVVNTMPVFGRSPRKTRQAAAYYSVPSTTIDISRLNMQLCSPSASSWFYQPSQLLPIRLDNLQLWPVYLPNNLITSGYLRNSYGMLSMSCQCLSLPTTSGIAQVPFQLIGNPVQVTSPYGPAILFQGGSQIQATYSPSLCYFSPQYCTDGFTICTQIMTASFGIGGSIFSNLATPTADGMLLYLNPNGTLTAYVHYGSAVWMATSILTLRLNVYNGLCFSWSPAGGVHLSINGACAAIIKCPQPYWGQQSVVGSSNAILLIGAGTYSTASTYNPTSSFWQMVGYTGYTGYSGFPAGYSGLPLGLPSGIPGYSGLSGGIPLFVKQAGAGNFANYQPLSFTLADIKLWNSKFYPSELYPQQTEGTGYNSQGNTANTNGNNKASRNIRKPASEGYVFLSNNMAWVPIAMAMTGCVVALVACLFWLFRVGICVSEKRYEGDGSNCSVTSSAAGLVPPDSNSIWICAKALLAKCSCSKKPNKMSRIYPYDESTNTFAMAVTFAANRNYQDISQTQL